MPTVRIEDLDDEFDDEVQFEKFSKLKKTKMRPQTKEGSKKKLPKPDEEELAVVKPRVKKNK